jgi:hypothetical protein
MQVLSVDPANTTSSAMQGPYTTNILHKVVKVLPHGPMWQLGGTNTPLLRAAAP